MIIIDPITLGKKVKRHIFPTITEVVHHYQPNLYIFYFSLYFPYIALEGACSKEIIIIRWRVVWAINTVTSY